MNRNLLTSLAFVAGAAAGSAITWKLLKTKYEKIAQEEIDSVKEVFSRRAETVEETVEEAEDETVISEEPSLAKVAELKSYKDVVRNYSAAFKDGLDDGINDGINEPADDISNVIKKKAEEIINDCDDIVKGVAKKGTVKSSHYIITPNEFDEGDNEVVTLVYYADGVVVNTDTLETLSEKEIDECVGLDSLNHFGEYEDDSVFVRNDKEDIDYEILRDENRYSDLAYE